MKRNRLCISSRTRTRVRRLALAGIPGLGLLLVMAATPLQAQTLTIGKADAQELKFSITGDIGTFRIPLEPSTDLKDVLVSVDDFVGPDGVVVQPSVTLDSLPANVPMSLKQTDRAILYVSATFATDGDYRSNVVLRHGETRAPSIPFVVTRTRNPGAVDIETVDAVAVGSRRGGSTPVRFVLQEKTGRSVTLDPPVLVNLSRKAADKTPKQASYTALRLSFVPQPQIQTRSASESSGGAVAVASSGASASQQPLTIEPWGQREFLMDIEGLRDAGEYTGTLRVTSRNAAKVDKAVTVYVKESGWWAFLFIALGVAASWLLRHWIKEHKPKLESLRRLEDTEEALRQVESSAGSPSADEQQAAAAIRSALSTIRRDIERRTASDVAARIDLIDKRVLALPRWITVGRRIGAASSTVDVTRTQEQWRTLIATYFLLPTAADSALDTALDTINTDLASALKEQMLATFQEFQRSFEAAKAADPQEAASLEQAVRLSLDLARTKADAGKLPEARGALLQAKTAFVRWRADRLIHALHATAPVGFSEVQWQELRMNVQPLAESAKSQEDPDAANASFESAHQAYLAAVLAGAKRQLMFDHAALSKSTTISGEDKAKHETTLAGVEETLREADGALAIGNLDEAARVCREAASRIAEVDAAILRSERRLDRDTPFPRAADVVSGFAPPTLRFAVFDEDLPDVAGLEDTRADRLSQLIDRYSAAFNIALLVIATILGMSLLWATDPVWGGWTSYTTAFLWGLGLHQVAGTSFEGLPGIARKLTE